MRNASVEVDSAGGGILVTRAGTLFSRQVPALLARRGINFIQQNSPEAPLSTSKTLLSATATTIIDNGGPPIHTEVIPLDSPPVPYPVLRRLEVRPVRD